MPQNEFPATLTLPPAGSFIHPPDPITSEITRIRNQLHGGRGLREEMRVAELVKKISAFCGTQRFIKATKFSRACY
jgi:hypothetical protein